MYSKPVLSTLMVTTLAACGTPTFEHPSSSSEPSSSASSSSAASTSSSSSSISSSSSSSSSVDPGGLEGLLFQDDFESYTVGEIPTSPWQTRVAFNTGSTDTSKVSVVSDSYSGAKAVRVSSTQQFSPSFIFLDLAPPAKQAEQIYVRMYLKAAEGLGGDGGHAHIVELSKDGQNGIRYGEANGSIGVNTVEGGDPMSPQPNQMDEDLAANQWYCVEALFDKRPRYDELTTWVDGAVVHRVSNDEEQWGSIWTNNGPDADWLETAFDNQIQFGWYAFSGVRGNSIYFDDIVLATERVGCQYLPEGVAGDGVIYD